MELFTLVIDSARIDATMLVQQLRKKLYPHLIHRVPLHRGTGIIGESISTNTQKKQPIAIASAIIASVVHSSYGACVLRRLVPSSEEILSLAHSLHRQTITGESMFQRALAIDLSVFLSDHPYVHIEGFLRFRAHRYRHALRRAIHRIQDD